MFLFKQLISLSLLTGGLLLVGEAAAQQNPTLADALKQEGIPTPQISVPHINSRITSYASMNDDREFVIAYYLDNPKNELRFPLLVTSFDKHRGKWRHAEFTGLKVRVFEGTDH